MYVVKVMPIARGAFKDHLSFFSKTALEPGMVVDVAIRNKKTAALVLASKDAREEKTQLKNESYSLKKLEPKKIRRVFSKDTVEALRTVAHYHAAQDGTALAHFTPSAIIGSETAIKEAKENEKLPDLAADCVALQAEYEERISTYRNTTREVFAKGESVVILAPTIPEAEKLYQELSRGIEEQTVLFTSNLTKKGTVTAWNRAVTDPEPLLLIMTHSFLTIPRENVSTYFIERESARSYVGREGARFDTRIAAEALATKRGSRVVFSDFPLRVETHSRLRTHDMDEFGRLQRTVRSGANARIVDARVKDEEGVKKKKFSPLTPSVQSLLETETKRGSRAFVYAARRGIAPLTVCNDCGTPVTDPATGAPMTLHKTEQGNVFVSFRSGAVLPSHSACRNCGGWNLVSLGIGAERVFDEIKKTIPNAPLFLLTTETAGTHAKAKKLMKQFFDTKGAVLVGTDRALPYLYEPVEYSIAASVDSILSSSAWRAHTHALHTLFYLQSRTLETTYVQTRLPDNAVIRTFASGNPTDFIDQELKDRKTFGYPPFTTFIGLTWHGTERAVKKNADLIKETLSDWELVGPLPSRATSKNRYIGRAVIRLEENVWPKDTLVQILKALPPDISITVDPDDIV